MVKIATIPAHMLPAIPSDVRAAAKREWRYTVDSSRQAVPHGATCWIWTKEVRPHTDPLWADDLFLTLSLVDGFVIDDAGRDPADGDIDDSPVCRGDLLIVDPMMFHWCYPRLPTSRSTWIGLQWEIPRRTATKQIRSIVREMEGQWISKLDVDQRYERIVP